MKNSCVFCSFLRFTSEEGIVDEVGSIESNVVGATRGKNSSLLTLL